MIILKTQRKINTINQITYSNIIFSLDFSLLLCPKCKSKDLRIHGYYKRNFKNNSITITRVRCPHCGSTHSILLFPMIPFVSSVSADDIVCILSDAADHVIIELSHLYYFTRKLEDIFDNILDLYRLFARRCFLSFHTT